MEILLLGFSVGFVLNTIVSIIGYSIYSSLDLLKKIN